MKLAALLLLLAGLLPARSQQQSSCLSCAGHDDWQQQSSESCICDDLQTLKDDVWYLKRKVDELSSMLQHLNDSTSGGGESSNPSNSDEKFVDCLSIKESDPTASDGVYMIRPYKNDADETIQVWCDMTTDGGGWIVFQNRSDGSIEFDREWANYINGFGQVDGEMWLGLKTIHKLTSKFDMKLRIELEDFTETKKSAVYSAFAVGGANSNFQLSYGGYSDFYGAAGDAFSYARQEGARFSTRDSDNDGSSANLADELNGGWWFYSSNHGCNLNGIYGSKDQQTDAYQGIQWYTFHGNGYQPLKSSKMMLRRKN